jgi:RHS repeat-associated protein
MATPADQVYCYHFNATGSTIAVTNASQTVVNKYAYDPFGNVADQVEAVSQPFKFVGQFGVMTEANGFYYMRARYYDPLVGRFISEDPIGFEGGDVNLLRIES